MKARTRRLSDLEQKGSGHRDFGCRTMKKLRVGLIIMSLVTAVLWTVVSAQAATARSGGQIVMSVDTRNHGDGCCQVLNLVTMNPGGGDVHQLTDLPRYTFAQRPSWSPSGDTIVFDLNNVDDPRPNQIWTINSAGTDMRLLVADRHYRDIEASYSPDGRYVLFSRCDINGEGCGIARIDADGTHLVMLTALDVETARFDQAAQYSPGGGLIAFWRSPCDGCGAIFIMRSDGTHAHRVTPKGITGPDVDWSPNGQQLIFGLVVSDGVAIGRCTVDGTGLKQLTTPNGSIEFFPSYSPNGKHIVFEDDATDGSNAFSLIVMNADGTNTQSRGPAYAAQPDWG